MHDNRTDYQSIAASQTAAALTGQFGVGAKGDILMALIIIPATSAAGAVTFQDGTNSAISLFAGGGTTALQDLKPLVVSFGSLGIRSTIAAWKVTTGTNVSVIAVGRFS